MKIAEPKEPKLVEALSGRSRCQTCRQLIEFRAIRIGMPAKHNGISITKWLHPRCFARHGLRCDYAPTDRAHCSGDGSPIRKGEPRLVMFLETCDKVIHQMLYKPPNAASFLRALLALPGVDMRVDAIEGLGELDTVAHRSWVESALAGDAVGTAPIRCAVSSPSEPQKAAHADPLFLDGCTIRVMWPQRCKGKSRVRRGTIFYRPQQSQRKSSYTYMLLTERRSGGLRERKMSWRKLRRRGYEVVSSGRKAPHRWSSAELAAAWARREQGESVQSVALALDRSCVAAESKLQPMGRWGGP
jgi:hypothetical protein